MPETLIYWNGPKCLLSWPSLHFFYTDMGIRWLIPAQITNLPLTKASSKIVWQVLTKHISHRQAKSDHPTPPRLLWRFWRAIWLDSEMSKFKLNLPHPWSTPCWLSCQRPWMGVLSPLTEAVWGDEESRSCRDRKEGKQQGVGGGLWH